MNRTVFSHILKRLGAGLTAAATGSMLLFQLAATVFAAEDTTGTTSGGFDYRISDGVVTVTGYSGTDRETVTKLSIPETVSGIAVTRIENSAFSGMTAVSTVSIPDTVEFIGLSAFKDMVITELKLPSSIQSIRAGFLDGCENLKTITIPKSMPINAIEYSTYMGGGWSSTFRYSSVETFILEDGIEHVPNYLTLGADAFQEIVIPDSVKTIGAGAFQSNLALTDFTVPEGVTEIQSDAFYDCKNLESIKLPSTLEKIGKYVFRRTAISSIALPDGLKEAQSSIFKECENLKAVTIPASMEKAEWMLCESSVETVTFADGMEKVPNRIAAEDAALTKVILPRSVTELGANCFEKTGITEFTVPKQLLKAENSFSESALASVSFEDGLQRIPDKLFRSAKNLKTINWNDSVTEIGEYAFADCDALETAEIPDIVNIVGYSAFAYCDNLNKVHLPDCNAKIGNNAFQECMALKSVYVPVLAPPEDNFDGYYDGYGCGLFQGSGLKSIEFAKDTKLIPGSVCYGCKNLTEIKWPDAPESIGGSAFHNCPALPAAIIPDTVSVIKDAAFRDCTALAELHLPESLTSLGEAAFRGTTSLKSLYFPHELESCGSWAFTDSGVETLEIADGVTKIAKAFCYMPELRTVKFPDCLIEIGDDTFWDCTKLTNVTLPPYLETLGGRAFAGCSSMTEITIPKTVTKASWTTFESELDCPSGLQEAWLEDGMTSVPEQLFRNAENLRTVHIPASMTEIREGAFANCKSLTTVDAPQKSLKFWSGTFRNCDALDDERFAVCLDKDSFVNCTLSADGENKLMHYTVYYSVNPRFRKQMSDISLKVSTAWRADIIRESLPEDISAGQTGFSFTPEKPEGVIRFSVRAENVADTSVKVTLGVKQDNGYDTNGWYERNIVSSGTPAPALSLNAPNYAKTEAGKASFTAAGYAPAGKDVLLRVTNPSDPETVAEKTVAASPYTGKFFADFEIAAVHDDVLTVQAVCGDLKQEATVMCDENQNEIVSVLLMHDGRTTDITESFQIGTMPFFAYRPWLPLGFEVKLADNDCASVIMTSTVNGSVSSIPLSYDAESDSWKGEGKFATTIPGTLNVTAFPKTYQDTVKLVKDGEKPKLMIGGRQFADSSEEEDAFFEDFVKDTNGQLLAADDQSVITGYDLSCYTGEASGIVSYLGRQDSLKLASGTITPQDVMDNPQKYGFDASPLIMTDEDGMYHVYYVKFLDKAADFRSLYDSIQVADTAEPAKPLPGKGIAAGGSPAGYQTLGQRFFNFLADLGGSADEAGNYANGTVVTEFVYNHAPLTPVTPGVKPRDVFGDDGNCKDFFINVADTGRKEVVDNAVKGMFKNVQTGEKVVEKWGDGMAYAEIGVRTTAMISQLRDITNSENPYVNAHENEFYAASVGLTMAKATHIVAGGWAVSATISAFGSVVAAGVTGAALLPEILAVGAVIGVVWGIGKLLDMANNKLNEVIRSKAKVGSDGRVRPIIDPSGIAYEYQPNNPIEGVTANIYYQDENGKAVLWNASDYDQENPQTTDHNGWFAWDVPEGLWQVRLTKEGFTDAESEWLPVPPVQVDVNLNMTSKFPAQIKTAESFANKVVVRFTRHVLNETVTPESLILTDASGKEIPCSITPVSEPGNDDTASLAFTLKPEQKTDLTDASVRLTPAVKSYAGIASEAETFITTAGAEEPQPEFLLGDTNLNDEVSVDDAQLTLNAYVKGMAGRDNGLTELQAKAADINEDGIVSVDDAQWILLYYVKNYLSGVATSWEDILNKTPRT